jgi:hypothetical protein
MGNKTEDKKLKKGFFARWMDKLDKKMEEKAKSGHCCCKGNEKEEGKSCCS